MSATVEVALEDEEAGETTAPPPPTPWLKRRIRRLVIGAAVSGIVLTGALKLLFRRRGR